MNPDSLTTEKKINNNIKKKEKKNQEETENSLNSISPIYNANLFSSDIISNQTFDSTKVKLSSLQPLVINDFDKVKTVDGISEAEVHENEIKEKKINNNNNNNININNKTDINLSNNNNLINSKFDNDVSISSYDGILPQALSGKSFDEFHDAQLSEYSNLYLNDSKLKKNTHKKTYSFKNFKENVSQLIPFSKSRENPIHQSNATTYLPPFPLDATTSTNIYNAHARGTMSLVCSTSPCLDSHESSNLEVLNKNRPTESAFHADLNLNTSANKDKNSNTSANKDKNLDTNIKINTNTSTSTSTSINANTNKIEGLNNSLENPPHAQLDLNPNSNSNPTPIPTSYPTSTSNPNPNPTSIPTSYTNSTPNSNPNSKQEKLSNLNSNIGLLSSNMTSISIETPPESYSCTKNITPSSLPASKIQNLSSQNSPNMYDVDLNKRIHKTRYFSESNLMFSEGLKQDYMAFREKNSNNNSNSSSPKKESKINNSDFKPKNVHHARSFSQTKRYGSYSPSFPVRHGSLSGRRIDASSYDSVPQSPATKYLAMFASSTTPTASNNSVDNDEEGMEIGNYVLGRVIGRGGFSIVREAHTIVNNKDVLRAAKIIRHKGFSNSRSNDNTGSTEINENRLFTVNSSVWNNSSFSSSCIEEKIQSEIDHEIEIWRTLVHPNILPLLDVEHTAGVTIIFTELMNGSLYEIVKMNKGGIGIDLIIHYSFQLALALRYLHEDVKVVHRDVKLENCLLKYNSCIERKCNCNSHQRTDTNSNNLNNMCHLYLCDFGMGDYYNADEISMSDKEQEIKPVNTSELILNANKNPCVRSKLSPSDISATLLSSVSSTTNNIGSLAYAAPEILIADLEASAISIQPTMDVWGFGVVLYALAAGCLPFQHAFIPILQKRIMNVDFNINLVWERVYENSNKDSKLADSVKEIIANCLLIDPSKRWTMRQILNHDLYKNSGEIV